ncbi:MAG: DoxX family protein [Flavobacteriales bacterium]|nr:DoxX family protein [Flavobacteriales bacterium]
MLLLRRLPDFVAAIILLQTLYFKFTGAAESVWIFETLGAEPEGRIGSGVMELIAAVLLFIRSTAWIGAGIALGTMLGAIASHVGVLGIEVMGDGGLLFALACIVAICAVAVLLRDRARMFHLWNSLRGHQAERA